MADFFADRLLSDEASIRAVCEYEPVTGNWFVRNKRDADMNTNATVRYGLERYNALFIIEASLNLRQIKLFDKNNRYSEADTVAALEKQKAP